MQKKEGRKRRKKREERKEKKLERRNNREKRSESRERGKLSSVKFYLLFGSTSFFPLTKEGRIRVC